MNHVNERMKRVIWRGGEFFFFCEKKNSGVEREQIQYSWSTEKDNEL
jgi:hypothetical protein